jgi:hypothetical protein
MIRLSTSFPRVFILRLEYKTVGRLAEEIFGELVGETEAIGIIDDEMDGKNDGSNDGEADVELVGTEENDLLMV